MGCSWFLDISVEMALWIVRALLVMLVIAISSSIPVKSSRDAFKLRTKLTTPQDVGSRADFNSSKSALPLTIPPKFKVQKKKKVKVSQHSDAPLAIDITRLQDSTGNIQRRSVCPWTYSIETDMNRQPADIVVARCIQSQISGTRNVCEHVYYNIPIKVKQASSSGVVTWTDGWVKKPVGCTLASAPIIQGAIPPRNTEQGHLID